MTSVVTVPSCTAGDPPAARPRCGPGVCGRTAAAACDGASASSTGLARISPSTSTVVSAASTTTSPVGAHAELADHRHRLVAGDAVDVVDRLLARPRRLVDIGRHDREVEPDRRATTPARRGDADGEHDASDIDPTHAWPCTVSAAGQGHDVVVVGDDQLVAVVEKVARAATTLIGPLVWPRLMRSPPATISIAGSSSPRIVVELGQRRDLRQPPTHSRADRVAGHVPGRVLAEVAHRQRLATVAIVVVGEQRGVSTHGVDHDAERRVAPVRRRR